MAYILKFHFTALSISKITFSSSKVNTYKINIIFMTYTHINNILDDKISF